MITLSSTNIQVFSKIKSLKITTYTKLSDFDYVVALLATSNKTLKEVILPKGGTESKVSSNSLSSD